MGEGQIDPMPRAITRWEWLIAGVLTLSVPFSPGIWPIYVEAALLIWLVSVSIRSSTISLAILLWFLAYGFLLSKAYDMVWPHERRVVGILNGTYAIDLSPPLPLIAWVLVYAIPTILVGVLVLLYRSGTRGLR